MEYLFAKVPEDRSEASVSRFWTSHLDTSCVHFIGSDQDFPRVEKALQRAVLIGLDAEWKPVSTRRVVTGQKSPRVSILQVACRLESNPKGDASHGTKGCGDSWHGNEDSGQKGEEVVFILDMLALSPRVFAGPLRAALRSPRVLKLGYALRDDMRHLAASHPGPEAEQCFDEVEPYVDIGRLYRRSGLSDQGQRRHPRESFLTGGGLSSVVDDVLGRPLCKDLQCSNWEERPLSVAQLTYAAADAHCLLAAFDKLSQRARAQPTGPPATSANSRASPVGIAAVLELIDHSRFGRRTILRPMRAEACQVALAAATSISAVGFTSSVTLRSLSTVGSADRDDASEGMSQSVRSDSTDDESGNQTRSPSEGQLRVNMSQNQAQSNGSESQTWSKMSESQMGSNMSESQMWSKMSESQMGSNMSESQMRSSWHCHWRDTVAAFGERLSLHDITNGKPRQRKGRKTRASAARAAQKTREEDEAGEMEWRGPAPWDPILGGNGVPKFLCDNMIEGLARQLRCVGLDTASPRSQKSDARQLVEQAEVEGRVLLTRDIKLLRRRLVPRQLAYRVRSLAKQEQLREVITTFGLQISEAQLLSRCIRCNGSFVPQPLSPTEAMAAAPWTQVLPPCALRNVSEFWQCSVCKHLYWEGSQFDRAFRQFASVCQTNAKPASSVDEEDSSNSSCERGPTRIENKPGTHPGELPSLRKHYSSQEAEEVSQRDEASAQEGGIPVGNGQVKGPRGKTFVCACRRKSSSKTKQQ